MIVRKLLLISYVAGLMGASAVTVLLVTALVMNWLKSELLHQVTGDAVLVGAALTVLSIGVRMALSTWLWLNARSPMFHG